MYHCRPETDGPRTPCGPQRARLALGALFLAAFVVGTAELMMVGVLPMVAAELGEEIGTAGALVSSYALGIALGGPLLTSLTMRLPRRLTLWVAFAAYVLGTVLAAVAVTFGLLVVARVVTGTLHGLFVGVALSVAPALVPPERTGRAISTVVGGVSVSTALGVPLGTLVAQQMGWRASFFAVAALGVVALAGVIAFVPATGMAGVPDLRRQARAAFAPRVLAVLAVGLLVMTGQFAALTFLSPFLTEVTGLSEGAVAAFLLVYGVATAAGTLAVGGWAADRNVNLAFGAGTALLVLAFALLYLAGSSPVAVAVGLTVWGVAGFAIVPSFQYRAVALAGPGRDLAATLPPSALTAGVALGSTLGGWAIDTSGPQAPVLLAAVLCLAVLPLHYLTTFIRDPAPAATGPAGDEPAREAAPAARHAEQQ